MPSCARTSEKAAQCSGSLLAMTPSKSKMIARSATSAFQMLEPFARANRNLEAVFQRRIRTVVHGIVVAKRVIGAIEVDLIDAGRIPGEIEVAAAGICFGTTRQIAEW